MKAVWLGLALSWTMMTSVQAGGLSLECDNLRRLSDNFLLDLRIRMVFEGGGTYTRYENTGRGWQLISRRRSLAITRSRIVLDETPSTTAYVERLTGDYYYVDRSGTTLSVWGRCGRVGPPNPMF
jgi:hypothetical protein